MKMLMFDYRESEEEFFNNNEFKDIDITFIAEPLNEFTELSNKQIEETDVISVFISSNVSESIIKKFKNLRIITTRSTGYNHIDVKYCSQNNIAVFNVEEYGQASVAQFTFALILAVIRNILPAYNDINKNKIDHPSYEGRNLEELTIGIIGCGAIGSTVAKIANFFKMKVLVCSYGKRNDISSFADYLEFEEVIKNSDIITLHLPYQSELYHMISKKEFEIMKDNVYIINTARGELIDILALYENLLSGKVKGAALDVYECEHLMINHTIEEFDNSDSRCMKNALIFQKLLQFDNVILTPHIAYNTKESIDTLLQTTFNNIRDFSKGMHSNQIC